MSEDKQCKSLNFSESPIGWRTWRKSWTFLLRSKWTSSTTSPISHRRCRCQSVSQSLWYCCQWQRKRQQQQQQQPKKALLFSIYVLFKENVDSTEWLFNLCEIAFNNKQKIFESEVTKLEQFCTRKKCKNLWQLSNVRLSSKLCYAACD